jgi:hypothetical protein
MKSLNWLAIVATVIENLAAGVALCGYSWIGSMPYHVTVEQERHLGIGYAVVGISLICAWLAALLSMAATFGSVARIGLKRWALISLAVTVAISLTHSFTVRTRSVRFRESGSVLGGCTKSLQCLLREVPRFPDKQPVAVPDNCASAAGGFPAAGPPIQIEILPAKTNP